MSGLISRGAILTASRLSNFAIQLFSPLLLVRVLDVTAYGQYQEFMIYAALLTTLCAFAVDSSLMYFLSRFPERERAFVSQTSAVILGISTLCIATLLVTKPLLLRMASYDFVVPLAAYVFAFVNLNWVEYYWLAKGRPRVVLLYSAGRLIARLAVLLVAAYTFRDVTIILWSLVGIESLRLILAFVYFSRRGLFVSDFKKSELLEQLKFAAPIGASAFVQNAGRSIGKIFISSALGPAALAYYVTGSYLQPVVRVARSGIEDAVYPDLVRAHGQPGGALRLWQRVNVLNCVMFFPAYVLLVFYSKEVVTTLFTGVYLPAVPIFEIYALFLLRRCFNTDVLLRTTGRSGFMLWGTLGSLAANVCLILALAPTFGMIGPAIAFIAAEVALEIYYIQRARKKLNLAIVDLVDWKSISKVSASCVLALPVLFVLDSAPGPQLLRLAIASAVYVSLVLFLSFRFGVHDVGRVVGYVWSRLRRSSSA